MYRQATTIVSGVYDNQPFIDALYQAWLQRIVRVAFLICCKHATFLLIEGVLKSNGHRYQNP